MNEPEPDASKTEPTLIERSLAGGALAAGSVAATGAPPLVTLAAGAAGAFLPFAEVVAHRVFDEFRGDARIRVDEMLASADQELGGVGPEKLADLTGKSEQTRLLTAIAVDAAARTTWPPRVAALGRVLAAGLIGADDARIDDEQLALSAMADMERPHVSLLELLVRWQPGQTLGSPEIEPYTPTAGFRGERLSWRPGRREWTFERISRARPNLGPVLASLMGTLQRHGLAIQNDNTVEAFQKFSAIAADDVNRRTRRGGGGIPTVPAAPRRLSVSARDMPEPTWSPTELGERVLGFYQLAADTAESERPPA